MSITYLLLITVCVWTYVQSGKLGDTKQNNLNTKKLEIVYNHECHASY